MSPFRRPLLIAALLLPLTLLAAGGTWWWKTRPQPERVAVTLQLPVARDYADPESRPAPLVLDFAEGVAPLAQIGKSPDIALEPALAGRWTWTEESRLEFQPRGDWPVGQRYVLRIDEVRLLRPGARLAQREFEFAAPAFTAAIAKAEFYQDPTERDLKQVVLDVRFSHPVDPRTFERSLHLQPGKPTTGIAGIIGPVRRDVAVQVAYDAHRVHAWVRSAPLALAAEPTQMEVTLERGIRAAAGGPATGAGLHTVVQIPGRFSLAIADAALAFATNDKLATEQLLTIQPSASVAPADLARALHAWLLPERHPELGAPQQRGPFDWTTPALVSDEIRATAQPLALEAVEPASERPAQHVFRYRAPPGRWLYVQVDKGLASFGGYELGRRFDATLKVPELPKEVRILGQGALLSLRGERRLSVYSRAVGAIRFEVARVLPDRLHLLATQAEGAFAHPEFKSWSLGFDDLAEVEARIEEFTPLADGAVQYHGFDLGPYLGGAEPGHAAGTPADAVRIAAASPAHVRTGVFRVRVQGWDKAHRAAVGTGDERLIVVTDLGLVVKRAVDGTEDVFVQSLARGAPVADARVEVVGRNGMKLTDRTTDAQGHARLPSLREMRREREPALYIVRQGEDAAFLPVGRSDRGLDYSRFDVGGVANAAEAGELSAYLFSDRGIYRPGDEFRIGIVVEAADWTRRLDGLPLEAVVTDARGAVVERRRLRLPPSGFDEIAFRTSESSATGSWNVALHIVKDGRPASRLGGTTLTVQEFLPDRMVLAVGFTRAAGDGWVAPTDLAARLSLRTLFGTAAGGRRIETRMHLAPGLPTFAAWKDFQFVDPLKTRKTFEETLAAATTSAEGAARLPLGLQRFDAGTWTLSVVVQAFEPGGGRAVTAARTALVSSEPWLIGLRADGDLGWVARDAAREVEIVAIDPALAAIEVPGLTLALVERRYVSVLERQPDGTLRYESRMKETQLSEERVTVPAGRLRRKLPSGAPGEFALVVRDARGRELNRIGYSVAGAGNVARSLERNAELELHLARRDIAPGEELEVSIRAPYAGAGLIAIERERVHAFRWFHAESNASVQRIRLPAGFEGNGYLTVTFVRDANSPEVFASPLSYGVVPFSANLEARRLPVTLDVPAQVRPGETLQLHYSTAKPSKIVLLGVDEGILQVAQWRNPDPLGFFFEKRALEVDTRQLLDLILPEFRQLVQAAAGGDQEARAARYLNPFRRRRDAPVAFWSGIVDAGPEARSFEYRVPDYFNGSLRIVAVAVSDAALGVAARSSIVRGDFVLLPNTPSAVAPGDEFEVTAGVTNGVAGSGSGHAVRVQLAAGAHLELLGGAEQELALDEGREQVVRWRLRARDALGPALLAFTAVDAAGHAARLETSIGIRPPGAFSSQLTMGAFSGSTQELPLTRVLRPERRRVQASISATPLALAGALRAWLDEYPYGCTEQLVSQALPAVVLARRPELGASNAQDDGARYARLLAALRARQNADGGFGYWPGDSEIAPYASVYALHLLVESSERGLPAPHDMLERGAAWLAPWAATPGATLGEERVRAYAIYVLTRMGRVASAQADAQVERLDARFGKRWRSDITAAWLAAAYSGMRAGRTADGLIAGVSFSDDAHPWPDDDERNGSLHYGRAEHDAQLLFLLARHFRARLGTVGASGLIGASGASAPVATVAIARAARSGPGTLSAGWMVLALDAQATAAESAPAPQLSIAALAAATPGAGERASLLDTSGGAVQRAEVPASAVRLRWSQTGAAANVPVYFTLSETGYDREVPAVAAGTGLEIVREYLDEQGRPATRVRQGEELRVRVRFRSTGKREYWDGVVVDVLPGGFEPIVDRQQALQGGWQPQYVDVREDRVVAFGPIGVAVAELDYRVRATTAGVFAVPPAYAESMYEPTVRAHSAGARIVVEARAP